MKRFMFFVLAVTIAAMPMTTYGWTFAYGDWGVEESGCCVRETSDGGFIISGEKGTSIWLIKLDSNGDTVWSKTFIGGIGRCVQQTSDEGYVFVGGAGTIWVHKTDGDGNMEWIRCFSRSSLDFGNCVQQTTDGGYIILGETGPTDVLETWLIKTDSLGDSLWTRIYGDNYERYNNWMQQTSDGGYVIVGGKSSSSSGDGGIFLIKTNEEGDILWTKIYGGIGDMGNYVQQTSDGGYIITGEKWYSGHSSDLWLLKTDSQGNLEWERKYSEGIYNKGKCVQQVSDGGYVIVGFSELSIENNDLWLLKTDASGNKKWDKLYGSNSWEWGGSVMETSKGGYIIVGGTYSVDTLDGDVWVMRTDEKGDTTDVKVEATTILTPKQEGLLYTMTPVSYFKNTGTREAREFYCHCEVAKESSPIPYYQDSILIDKQLAPGDSVRVEFSEWRTQGPAIYKAVFYTSSESQIPWVSRSVTVIFEGTGILEDNSVGIQPSWGICPSCGFKITLKYSGYPQGFAADIYDASGRKVDEIKSSSCSGMVTWGECYGPGVYFIVPRIGVESPRKVILIR